MFLSITAFLHAPPQQLENYVCIVQLGFYSSRTFSEKRNVLVVSWRQGGKVFMTFYCHLGGELVIECFFDNVQSALALGNQWSMEIFRVDVEKEDDGIW